MPADVVDVSGIAFSCVVDQRTDLERAALLWAHCLLDLENLRPEQIFIHTVEPDLDVLPALRQLGVNIVEIPRFGDGKHCNKLAQPTSPVDFGAELLVMCDCDIAPTGRLAPELAKAASTARAGDPRYALGKTVDFCNPPLAVLEELMRAFDIGDPRPLSHDTLGRGPMPRGYFNGGLIGLPAAKRHEFGAVWQDWATRLLSSNAAMRILGAFSWHIDQISFYFALRELGFDPHLLDERFNFPIHAPYPATALEGVTKPFAIHYHNNIDRYGFLGLSGIRPVDLEVSKVNALITSRGLGVDSSREDGRSFDDWQTMEADFSMTSKNAPLLRKLLAAAGVEKAESVLDVRCSSAHHFEGLSVKRLRCYDPREAQISLAARRDVDGEFLQDIPGKEEGAELVLCLDYTGFAESLPSGSNAAELLGDLAGERLLVLGEPQNDLRRWQRGSEFADVASDLAKSGKFADLIELGQFAGRSAYIAISKRLAPSRVNADLFRTPEAKLYRYLDQSSHDASGPAEAPLAIGTHILKRLPELLDGLRAGVSRGQDTDTLALALQLRGCGLERLEEVPEDDGQDTQGPGQSIEGFDYLVISTSVQNQSPGQDMLTSLLQRLRPGGTLFLVCATAKRSNTLKAPGFYDTGSHQELVAILAGLGMMEVASALLPLSFDEPADLILIEAQRVQGHAPLLRMRHSVDTPKARRHRTPEFLKRFERAIRHRIKRKGRRK
ncbi:MAG: hypothetical protein AAGE80_14455 [Pseudomonadota bacterium]